MVWGGFWGVSPCQSRTIVLTLAAVWVYDCHMTKTEIAKLHQSSRVLCDIEDAIKASWRLGDVVS